jgi:hypothetical protein
MKQSLPRLVGAAVLAVAALSGCATGYLLDNSVQSFSSLPALPASPTYRFDRLLSQQAPQQAQLETFADAALFRAGLRRDDAAPRYAVQLTARVQRVLSPWADPWDSGWGPWGGGGFSGVGLGFGFGGPFPRMDQPWFHREVGVVMRELPGNRVVYETHASNDGPWGDNASVLPAMFDAALQGFPNPPPGVRRVDIQVGAKQKP